MYDSVSLKLESSTTWPFLLPPAIVELAPLSNSTCVLLSCLPITGNVLSSITKDEQTIWQWRF